MPKPRKHLAYLDATPYYHGVSHSVRRTYLCSFDRLTNTSHQHRRQWIEDSIHFLAQVFAIDVSAHAVMSNHTNLCLRINKAKNLAWSDIAIFQRWHQIYKGTVLTQKYLRNKPLGETELMTVRLRLDKWRLQL